MYFAVMNFSWKAVTLTMSVITEKCCQVLNYALIFYRRLNIQKKICIYTVMNDIGSCNEY